MSESPVAAGRRAHSPSFLLLARGIPALVVGLLATFTGGHSAVFGLLVVGVWGLVSGVTEGVLFVRQRTARWRTLELTRAVAVAGCGVLALAAVPTAAPAALVYLVGIGALVWGGLDLAAGLVGRGATPLAREFLLHGGAGLLLGILSLVVQPGYLQRFPGAAGQSGVLTASTTVVGFFGAWGIVIGVLCLIAAVGQRAPAVER